MTKTCEQLFVLQLLAHTAYTTHTCKSINRHQRPADEQLSAAVLAECESELATTGHRVITTHNEHKKGAVNKNSSQPLFGVAICICYRLE